MSRWIARRMAFPGRLSLRSASTPPVAVPMKHRSEYRWSGRLPESERTTNQPAVQSKVNRGTAWEGTSYGIFVQRRNITISSNGPHMNADALLVDLAQTLGLPNLQFNAQRVCRLMVDSRCEIDMECSL